MRHESMSVSPGRTCEKGGTAISSKDAARAEQKKGRTAPERNGTGRAAVRLLLRAAVLAAVLWAVFTYGFLITQVRGQGMFPALKDGDLAVVFRRPAMALLRQPLAQDDVIAYTADGRRCFGRIVAVAGDTVTIGSDGHLAVNGVTEGGTILFPTYAAQMIDLTLEEGTLYVLGDYRTHAEDSRTQGPIPLACVEGKVITILRRREL